MTAPSVSPAPTGLVVAPSHKPHFGNLMLSEWTKIRSVRSTLWTLILFVIITVGLATLLSIVVVATWGNKGSASGEVSIKLDPVGFIMGAGLTLGQLTICVLGVLVMSTEYSTGVIRASLLAVPKRLPMLAAKSVVFALVMIVASEIVCVVSFLIGSAILSSHVSVSFSDHLVARAVLGSGLYLVVLGLFSLGVGGLIRHTAGGISAAIGMVLVLPIITNFLPDSWGKHINAYILSNAGQQIGETHLGAGSLLSSWQGFGVECIWAAVVLIAAAVMLKRRDA